MTRRIPAVAATLAVATFAACSKAPPPQAPQGPTLPPLQLRAVLPEFHALAKTRSQPTPTEQNELRELGDIALQLVEADARLATRAERSLLEHPQAAFVLEPALSHESVAVRRRAAWLCGRSQQPILQLALLLALKYEKDPETVVWLADALQARGNDAGLAWLDAAIGDARTAEHAGQLAIAALVARSVTLPESPTWEQVRTPLQKLVADWRENGTPSLPGAKAPPAAELEARLAAHLVTPDGWQLRPVDEARHVLRNLGVLGVPMMCRMIVDERHHLRTMPLEVLANLGHTARSAADPVLPLLGDTASCADAIRVLGEIGATQHTAYLRRYLGDHDSELRRAAVIALGLLKDEASRAVFEQRLADTKETADVRVGAAFALRCFGDHAAAEAFLAERAQQKDYHPGVLTMLRERLPAMAK
ncbi:MAG: HEAT repeat domain-containing protein [Planctomycetota bacterium]